MQIQRDQGRTQSVRLPEPVVEAVLDHLDRQPGADGHERRAHKRYPYRSGSVSVSMKQPGALRVAHYVVQSRNLSARGLAFLHGGFVHKGTKMVVRPITRDGEHVDVLARVVACRYVERGIHEVSVCFENEIEPSDYCVGVVRYRILLVEEDRASARLQQYHLSMLNADVDHVRNGREAVNRLAEEGVDCVLIDIDRHGETPGLLPAAVVRRLRFGGFEGLVVAMSKTVDAETEQFALEMGCNDLVENPVIPTSMRRVLSAIDGGTIVSRFHDDPTLASILNEFVRTLPGTGRRIVEAVDQRERGDLEKLSQGLSHHALRFGFDMIARESDRIVTGCRHQLDWTGLRRHCGDLIATVKRAVAPIPKADPARGPVLTRISPDEESSAAAS